MSKERYFIHKQNTCHVKLVCNCRCLLLSHVLMPPNVCLCWKETRSNFWDLCEKFHRRITFFIDKVKAPTKERTLQLHSHSPVRRGDRKLCTWFGECACFRRSAARSRRASTTAADSASRFSLCISKWSFRLLRTLDSEATAQCAAGELKSKENMAQVNLL